jgi:predicted nucleotidyltransferase
MPILPNEKKALDELRDALKKKYKMIEFKVFGSKAKGTDDYDSDVDVMNR